jgi:hypothetical protein
MPLRPAVPDVVAVDVVRPRSPRTLLSSVDNPELDDVEEAAGVARLCNVWEISPDNDACALPAAVPVAWVAAALCAADPARLVVCGASVNGVTWLAVAEFAA